ncbi:MAG: hypothetical protein MZW92_57060 [Comamonadaceae bacterium]|nr:hypothetical protein [Comamonadaceae bacterium]
MMGLLTALLVAIAATGLLKMSAMQAQSEQIVTDWLPSVESINRLDATSAKCGAPRTAISRRADPAGMIAVETERAARLAAFQEQNVTTRR